MAKCKNDILLNRVTVNPLNKDTVLTFKATEALPACKTIITKNFVDASGQVNYKKTHKPVNRFECDATGCLSGTQYLSAEGNATYFAAYNANDFANGIITLYVKPETAGAGEVTVTIGNDAQLTNADQYTKTYTASDITEDGYVPILVNLSEPPTTTVGTGWENPSASGAYINITTSVAAGISSITIYDSIDDFVVNEVIQISCLSGIEGSSELSVLEAECANAGYDTSEVDPLELTLTGKMMTPNFWALNPRAIKGDKEHGFDNVTEKFTITDRGDGYGVVTLPGTAEECGWIKAQVSDSCDIVDSELELLSIPALVDLEENQYLTLDAENGATDVVFNSALIGEEVKITYAKRVEVQNHHVYSIANVGDRKYDLTYTWEYEDGTKTRWVFHNVLITSFPLGITNEESEFEFTVSVVPNANGYEFESFDIIG